MAYELPVFKASFLAAKDLSSYQYQVMRLTTAQTITIISSAATTGGAPIGILQDKPTSGVQGSVMVLGITKAHAGGTIKANQLIGMQLASTTFPGKLVAASTATKAATKPCGRALTAGTSGAIFTAMVNFIPVHGWTS